MNQGSDCTTTLHVWRRDEQERNSPVTPERHCVCLTIRFVDLPQGEEYLTEYNRPDGSVAPGGRHTKRDSN